MSDDSNNLIDLLFMLLAKKVIKLSPQKEEGTLGSSCFLLFREESVVPAFPRAFHKLLSLSSGLGGEPFFFGNIPTFFGICKPRSERPGLPSLLTQGVDFMDCGPH